jgi:hypothetical protein
MTAEVPALLEERGEEEEELHPGQPLPHAHSSRDNKCKYVHIFTRRSNKLDGTCAYMFILVD